MLMSYVYISGHEGGSLVAKRIDAKIAWANATQARRLEYRGSTNYTVTWREQTDPALAQR